MAGCGLAAFGLEPVKADAGPQVLAGDGDVAGLRYKTDAV